MYIEKVKIILIAIGFLMVTSNSVFPQENDSTYIDSTVVQNEQKTVSRALYADQTIDTTFNKASPTIRMFKSLLIPGWGQLSNKKYIKAGIIIAGELALLNEIIYLTKKASDAEKAYKTEIDANKKVLLFNDFLDAEDDRDRFKWYLATVIFLSMFDAFVDAHLSNFPEKSKGVAVDITSPADEYLGIKLSYNF
jgi:hypothetical protein